MRNLIAPAVLAFSLVAGSAAFAATPAPAPTKTAMTTTKTTPAAKKAECEKAWNSQKTHTGDKNAYVKACVAKG